MSKRLWLIAALVVAIALIVPSNALAYSWTHSPSDPLIKGGVYSKTKFVNLLSSSYKERSALKAVIAADGYPSWIFNAAVAEAKAGDVHSASLKPGTYIGAMAYGLKKTKIAEHTTWNGDHWLPYYYVDASRTAREGNYLVTRTYKVCMAKPCGNPFVVPRSVVKKRLYKLYVEKRSAAEGNPLLAGWTINGTVGTANVSVVTKATGPTLVGYYLPGTAYELEEVAQEGWFPQSPQSGAWSGTMPAKSMTLTWINIEREIPQ